MRYTEAQCQAFRDFEASPSVKEIRNHLDQHLISHLEAARYIMQVWAEFRRLPQYVALNMPTYIDHR